MEEEQLNGTTQALQTLNANLKYAGSLVESGEKLEVQGDAHVDVMDLYRSAWVMAVAALDHWVFEEIHHRMVALLMQPTGPKPAGFYRLELPVDLFDRVYHQREPVREIFEEFVRKQFSHKSFQNPVNIKDGFKYVTDVGLWSAVAKQDSRANGTLLKEKDVTAKLKRIMARRNQIVHQSDIDTERPGRRCPVKAEEVRNVIDDLKNLAAHIVMAIGQ